MFDINFPEIKFALQAVRQASLLVRQVQIEKVAPGQAEKKDRSPVTVADFASQALVAHLLAGAFPGDPLVAEEDSAELRQPVNLSMLDQVVEFVGRFASSATPQSVCDWIDHGRVDSATRFWTLDPIDGTKGFLRGGQYAAALALVVDGQVQIGALGCPNLVDAFLPQIGGPGCLVVAVRGQGTWTTTLVGDGHFKQLLVSSQEDPAQARILRSFESGHTNVSQVDAFADTMGVQAEPVRMDSQAKYAVLAAGRGELYLRLLSPSRPDYRERIWDQAAGSLVLEEAGGQISDLDGVALDFTTGRALANNRGILASNAHLHAAALRSLRQVGA